MAELVRVPRLTDQEGPRLQQNVRRGSTSSVRFRRAMMLLTSAGEKRIPVIAKLVQADKDTVRDVIHRGAYEAGTDAWFVVLPAIRGQVRIGTRPGFQEPARFRPSRPENPQAGTGPRVRCRPAHQARRASAAGRQRPRALAPRRPARRRRAEREARRSAPVRVSARKERARTGEHPARDRPPPLPEAPRPQPCAAMSPRRSHPWHTPPSNSGRTLCR